jgi:predicted SAM-dependent methyltransferase
MLNNLAPIGLSTYGRLQHLQQSIAALQKNLLAPQSELYLFSDAPKAGDEEKVAGVRSYLRTIDGFKKVHIIERDSNGRVANSRGGLEMLLDKFGKVIFLAEDIITAPGFLDFINSSLSIYEKRKDVFAICGYTPPVKLSKFYKKDIHLSLRFSGWGFGIWANRYNKICRKINYEEFFNNKLLYEKTRKAGEDYLALIKRDADGEIDAGDVKILYTMMRNNCYIMAPTNSLVNNIGLDGTGVHCGITDRFDVNLTQSNTPLNIPLDIAKNDRVIETIYCFSTGRKPPGFAKRAFSSTIQMLPSSLKNILRKYWHVSRNYWNAVNVNIHALNIIIKIFYKKILALLIPFKIPETAEGKTYLHLGCGKINREEFINIDAFPYHHVNFVQSIDKLSNFKDNSVDLIYACHCLEHFCYSQTESILREWFRVLKEGGVLRLSVPDFDKLVEIYTIHDHDPEVILPQLMGGQNNKYNYHLTAFNKVNLTKYLKMVGFPCVREWRPRSEELTNFDDLSIYKKEVGEESYEISLNIEAIKGVTP